MFSLRAKIGHFIYLQMEGLEKPTHM